MRRARKTEAKGIGRWNPVAVLLVAIGAGLTGCAETPGEGAHPTSEELGDAVTGAENRAAGNEQRPIQSGTAPAR